MKKDVFVEGQQITVEDVLEKVLEKVKDNLQMISDSVNSHKLFVRPIKGVTEWTIWSLMQESKKADNKNGPKVETLLKISKSYNIWFPSLLFGKAVMVQRELDQDVNPWNTFIENVEALADKDFRQSDSYYKLMGPKGRRKSGLYFGCTNRRLVTLIRVMYHIIKENRTVNGYKLFVRQNGLVYDDERKRLEEISSRMMSEKQGEMLAIRVGTLKEMEREYSLIGDGEKVAGWMHYELCPEILCNVRGSFENGEIRLDNWKFLYERGVVKEGDLLIRFFHNDVGSDEIYPLIVNLSADHHVFYLDFAEYSVRHHFQSIRLIGDRNSRKYSIELDSEEAGADPFHIYHAFPNLGELDEAGNPMGKETRVAPMSFSISPGWSSYREEEIRDYFWKKQGYPNKKKVTPTFNARSNRESGPRDLPYVEFDYYKGTLSLLVSESVKEDEKKEAHSLAEWELGQISAGLILRVRKLMDVYGFPLDKKEAYEEQIAQKGVLWLIENHRLQLEVRVPRNTEESIQWLWKLNYLAPENDSREEE